MVTLIAFGIWQKWDHINPPDFSHIPEGEIEIYTNNRRAELCNEAVKRLTKLKVPFKEYNEDSNKEGKRFYKNSDGQHYPVIIFGDSVEVGYSEKGMLYILRDRYPKQ